MDNNRKTLPTKAVMLFQSLQSEGKNIFTRKQAKEILKVKASYLNNLLSNLESMGWVRRLERGKYLIIPLSAGERGTWSEHPYIIASYLVEPYCIAYWSALSHWHYTEQLINTTFILTTRRKFETTKQVLGQTYKFVRVPEKKFFGGTQIWIENRKINITDREKTIVDCLDHPEYCGGIVEAAKAVKTGLTEKQASTDKLLDYAARSGNKTVFKRLGYLVETLELGMPELEKRCLNRISRGYSKLDPSAPGKGRHIRKWNILENVSRDELTVD